MSKWKAGQCVTIEGKRYRVTKPNNGITCIFCAFLHKESNEYPCSECLDWIPRLIPYGCYFKEIKPKS